MTSPEHVAGHPIAIRVGGRRLSQSHPTRASPTKAATQSSPSTSPEDKPSEPQPTPDYPRPTSVPSAREDVEEGSGGAGEDSGNRKERRRRQEKRKDKYQTEEDKMHGLPRGYPFDLKQSSKEGKGLMNTDKAKRNSASTGGVRITQPVSKFMT